MSLQASLLAPALAIRQPDERKRLKCSLRYDAVDHNGQTSFPFTDEPSVLKFLLAM